jgi:superfamily II DNA or RNA helicase
VRLDQSLVNAGSLRGGQLGAMHAVLAHASRSRAAAQVILPTGVGKTLVLTMVPYLLRARKVLVVCPGKLVRDQIIAGFLELSLPKSTGLLPPDTRSPRVQTATRLATKEDWREWRQVDVVVGTPNVLSHGYPDVQRVPPDLFDLVIFDEAHHLPATTWTKLYEAVEAPAVLLTATPFRSDGKRLPGDIAYDYPLRRAIEDEVYAPVTFVAVDDPGDEHRDEALAIAAAERLASPEHQGANSRLLVRTNRIEAARELEQTYGELDVPLGVIVADTSLKEARAMRKRVELGELQGFICVGALTEGFDFPSLKIAAYHEPHKTLGPTLQFVGRLARVGDIGGELLAVRRDVNDETSVLYREDPAWRTLLPDLVDVAVDREREIRRFIDETTVSGPLDLPPLALTPSRMAHVYRLAEEPNFSATPDKIAGASVVQRLHHTPTGLLGFVTRRMERPRFLRLDTLDTAAYELHLVAWVQDPGVLFVSTGSLPALKDLRAAVGALHARGLGAIDLRRLLDAADLERCFSVGLRTNRGHDSATTYRNNAGRKAEDDVTESDARTHTLGHVMGRGSEGSGTFGFSVAKSKVWEPGSADSLFAFREWCSGHAVELKAARVKHRQSALDRLAISEPFERFPAQPLAAFLPPEAFISGARLLFDGEIILPERVVAQASISDDDLVVEIVLDGVVRATFAQTPAGFVTHRTGAAVLVDDPGEDAPIPLDDWIYYWPWTVIFASGAQVVGDRVSAPPPAWVTLDEDVRVTRDWSDTDITKEFDPTDDDRMNVAGAALSELSAETPMVIQDHLALEIADFVGLRVDPTPQVHLVHCKSSASQTPAARLGDIEELAAQAMRSVRWLNSGPALWTELLRRLDERRNTSVVAGSDDEIRQLLHGWEQAPPAAEWIVWLVQPGVSSARLDNEPGPSTLLSVAHSWCADQQAGFRLLCSE